MFQGKYMDQTGGSQSNEAAGNEQYQNGDRYLESGWMAGTFGEQDPLDDPFETNGWNRYNYAGQDAVNLSDPNGIYYVEYGGIYYDVSPNPITDDYSWWGATPNPDTLGTVVESVDLIGGVLGTCAKIPTPVSPVCATAGIPVSIIGGILTAIKATHW
jgi:hypothetical protein